MEGGDKGSVGLREGGRIEGVGDEVDGERKVRSDGVEGRRSGVSMSRMAYAYGGRTGRVIGIRGRAMGESLTREMGLKARQKKEEKKKRSKGQLERETRTKRPAGTRSERPRRMSSWLDADC